MKQSQSSREMKQSPFSGGMTTETTSTPIELSDNAYWPDEALLDDFIEKDDQAQWPDQPLEDSSDYAVLYFVS